MISAHPALALHAVPQVEFIEARAHQSVNVPRALQISVQPAADGILNVHIGIQTLSFLGCRREHGEDGTSMCLCHAVDSLDLMGQVSGQIPRAVWHNRKTQILQSPLSFTRHGRIDAG